jgi:hypothetical protein
MFRLNTRLRSFQEELFEAFMPESLDHLASVTWNDSGNKGSHGLVGSSSLGLSAAPKGMLNARFRGHDRSVALKGTLEIPSFLGKRESSGIDCKLTNHATGLPQTIASPPP